LFKRLLLEPGNFIQSLALLLAPLCPKLTIRGCAPWIPRMKARHLQLLSFPLLLLKSALAPAFNKVLTLLVQSLPSCLSSSTRTTNVLSLRAHLPEGRLCHSPHLFIPQFVAL
jgi:hypothetical protein